MESLLETPAQTDAVSAWMIFRSLKASKLLSLAEIAHWEERAEQESIEVIRQQMLDENVLTPYQISRLKDGTPQCLVMGQYRILDEIGKGGCGCVYKARHHLMDRIVALKLINPIASKNVSHRELFLREIIATTRLFHPNIATAYDANEDNDQLYFAMEYIEGPTLHHLVQTNGPLPISVVCSYLLQSAEALRHAHEKGIVHRDIKPANIILTHEQTDPNSNCGFPNHLKILDFGLCRLSAITSRILQTIPCETGAIVGTPAFIAPEQISDVHSVDARSDLYSLGCTFYYALTGKLPFDGLTTKATLLLHLEYDAKPVSSFRAIIPAGLTTIITRLLAKKPSDRYSSAAELIDAINGFILGGGLRDSAQIINHPRMTVESTLRDASERAVSSSHIQLLASSSKPVFVSLEVAPGATPLPEETLVVVEQFQILWTAWFELVVRISKKEKMTIDPMNYETLYRNLLESIQFSQNHPEGLAPKHAKRLHGLIEPWVSVRSLTSLDAKTIAELVSYSQQIDRTIWSGTNRPFSEKTTTYLKWSVVILVVAAIFFYVRLKL